MQLVVRDGFTILIQKIDSKDSSNLQRVTFHDVTVKHDTNIIVNR